MASFIKSFFSPSKSTNDDDSDNNTNTSSTATSTTNNNINTNTSTQNKSPVKQTSATMSQRSSSKPQPQITLDSIDSAIILSRATIELSLQQRDQPKQVKSSNAILLIVKRSEQFQYDVRVFIDDVQKLSQSISSKLPTWFDSKEHSIQWIMSVSNQVLMWHAKFISTDEEQQVKWVWQQCIAEQARQEQFNKAYDIKKDITQQWIKTAYDEAADIDMNNDSDIQVKQSSQFEYKTPGKSDFKEKLRPSLINNTVALDSDSEDDDDDDNSNDSNDSDADDEQQQSNKFRPGDIKSRPRHSQKNRVAKNEQLAVGMAVNRTFVSRGNMLGIFKHDEHGDLQYVNQLDHLKYKDQLLSPNKMMLTDADNKMLILNNDGSHKIVYEMDLNRGEIVNEYKGSHSDFIIRDVDHTTKYGELDNATSLFNGVNKGSIFTIDKRIDNHDDSVVAIKTYANANQTSLNTLASTEQGYVAVGSDKGEIRLFNDITKNAKTLLPGLGDPIISLDVTRDGKYILVTCSTYLLLVPTATDSINGFTKSITSSARPPIKLQLKAEDVLKYNITDINFTAAHFDIGQGAHQEDWIVTSTGPFIITWNFSAIKKSTAKNRYDYKIKQCATNIVAEQFIYNRPDHITVELPDDIYVQTRG